MLTGTSTLLSAEKLLMRNTAHSHSHPCPLHVHISAMFTFLLLLLGIVLGVFNYQQTTLIILSSSQKLFSPIEHDVQQDLLNTYQPIRHALNLLALNPDAITDQVELRTGLLQPFVQTLEDNHTLAALYLGDDAGNFFLVRPLRNEAARLRVKAPSQASYEVWTIERSAHPGAVESKKQYLDASMVVLEQRAITNEVYDPPHPQLVYPRTHQHRSSDHSPLPFFHHPGGRHNLVQTQHG